MEWFRQAIEGVGALNLQRIENRAGERWADYLLSFDPAYPLDFAPETGELKLEEGRNALGWALGDHSLGTFPLVAGGVESALVGDSHLPDRILTALVQLMLGVKAQTGTATTLMWEWEYENALLFKVKLGSAGDEALDTYAQSVPESFGGWMNAPLQV